MLEELDQLGTTDAVGAVNRQLAVNLAALQGLDESIGKLLVVAKLADLAVGLRSALGVDAAGEVVELGSGEDLVVGVFGVGGLERVGKGSDELVARGAGVSTIDNAGGRREVDAQLGSQGFVVLDKLLVRGAVHKLGSIRLPLLLKHITHRVNNFDTIVGGRVVAGRNHDTNGLTVKLAAAEAGEEADAEGDSIQKIGLHPEPRSAILEGMVWDDGVLLRSGNNLLIHGEWWWW